MQAALVRGLLPTSTGGESVQVRTSETKSSNSTIAQLLDSPVLLLIRFLLNVEI